MVKRRRKIKIFKYISLFVHLLLLGLSTAEACTNNSWKVKAPIALELGDLVFRRGQGAWTHFFVNASSREKRFSHVGIVSGVGDEINLIHADADEYTGRGCVHTEKWNGFFENALECAVFRYEGDSVVASNMVVNAKRRLGVEFDSLFDMSETNKLYCSEMVRIVVNEASKTNLVGYSEICGRKVVALDDLYRTGFIRIYDSCE